MNFYIKTRNFRWTFSKYNFPKKRWIFKEIFLKYLKKYFSKNFFLVINVHFKEQFSKDLQSHKRGYSWDLFKRSSSTSKDLHSRPLLETCFLFTFFEGSSVLQILVPQNLDQLNFSEDLHFCITWNFLEYFPHEHVFFRNNFQRTFGV